LLNKITIKPGKVPTYYRHYKAGSIVFPVHAMKAYWGGWGWRWSCSYTPS